MTTCWVCLCLGAFAAASAQTVVNGATELRADVCIVGGGSGGIGAAIAASRAGATVILIEKQARLGGTSTRAYVCNWEPGPGDRIAREIYDRLRKVPNAVGVVSDHNRGRKKGPFGLWLVTPGERYEQTLKRSARPVRVWRAVTFEPDAFSDLISEMLAETHRCRTLLETRFTKAKTDGKRVVSIEAESADGVTYRVCAEVFIDSTGGGHLCRAVGCETMLGPETKRRFGEPSAPDKPIKRLNAISLCYRIRKSDDPVRQVPPDPPVKRWPRSAHVSGLACGDRIVNPLGMLPGQALIDLGYERAMAKAKRIAQAHWRWLQGQDAFAGYELHSFAPMLGIRESYRVVGEYVLTEHDLRAGLSTQKHPDIIAIADHAMDVHGAGGRCKELSEPYGIPYRCLIPKGWTNLLIACRGASFSQIGASSCRLSRTMISIGHAAGVAAALAARNDVPVGKVDMAAVRAKLDLTVPK